MNRRRHWIFWVNCVAELVLILVLLSSKSQSADGFGAGPDAASRVSKKVRLILELTRLILVKIKGLDHLLIDNYIFN